MVQRNTPCAECRNDRRKCIRDSPNNTCSRCRRLDRPCVTTNDMSLSYSENSKHVIEQIEYLNSIVSDLETQIDLFQNTTSDNIGGGDWKLTIKNGKLRIETGIKSIADLLLHCPPIPFQIPKTGLVVEFNPRKNTCLRLLTSKLLMKCLDTNQNTFISLPTSFLLDARSVMDRLIHIYFECHNTFNPLIHQPSFLDYYKQLVNPLDSLLCLCICCHVCGAPCQHTHGDLTSIGRYFSGLAKMKLMDQFDVKEKRIENMISINLLGSYLHFLLLNRESKKIAAINYQIAMDLFPWYKRQSNSVEGALYSRNVSLIVSYQKSMGLPDEGHSILQEIASLPWRAMDDENRELVDYVDGHNHLLRLYHHSIMFELKSRTQEVLSGGVCTLPFEMIVQLDEVINAWWDSLPKRYKICDSWLDLDQCRQYIDRTTDGVGLIIFTGFLNHVVGVYSQMLQPKSDSSVLSIVEKMILERALYCCQMVLYGFNKANWIDILSPCRYILAMKWYLIRIADVLIALCSSSNSTIKKEAQSVLASCIGAIESMTFMKQGTLNSIQFPLFTKGPALLEDLDNINLTAYSNCPQPWYALIYDVCRYLTLKSIA